MKIDQGTLLVILIGAAVLWLFEGLQISMIFIAGVAVLCLQCYFVIAVYDWLVGEQKPSRLKSIALLGIATLNVYGLTTPFSLALWGSLMVAVVVVLVIWARARLGF